MDFDIDKAEAIIIHDIKRTYQSGMPSLLDGKYPVQIVVNKCTYPIIVTSNFCGMVFYFDEKGHSTYPKNHFLSL